MSRPENLFDVVFTESGRVGIDRLGVVMSPEQATHLATHLLVCSEMAQKLRARRDSADCMRVPVGASEYLTYLANTMAKG